MELRYTKAHLLEVFICFCSTSPGLRVDVWSWPDKLEPLTMREDS